MTADIAVERLHNQHLAGGGAGTPEAAVAWMGAVQSQEYEHAKWALGLRTPGANEAAVEQALTEGRILRTHILRPTWHYVMPEDIRWIQELTSKRVVAAMRHYDRELEVDEPTIQRSKDIFIQALRGGRHLTRLELEAALAQAGIIARTRRLGHLVMYAELDAILCSGPRHGKQISYMLVDERAPQARTLAREEALAELTRRYFTSHGPALVKDFAWWSGLTIADVKAGLELAKNDLVSEQIGDQTYWRPALSPSELETPPQAYLLPPFDEFTVAYKDHSPLLEPHVGKLSSMVILNGVIVINCRVVGNWRRTIQRKTLQIETTPFRPFTPPEQLALAAAAEQLGEFLGLPVELV